MAIVIHGDREKSFGIKDFHMHYPEMNPYLGDEYSKV